MGLADSVSSSSTGDEMSVTKDCRWLPKSRSRSCPCDHLLSAAVNKALALHIVYMRFPGKGAALHMSQCDD